MQVLGDLIRYHKTLEKVFDKLKTQGIGVVFSEGVYELSYLEELKAFYKKVNAIAPKPGVLKEFADLYEQANRLKGCGSDIVDYLLMRKLNRLT